MLASSIKKSPRKSVRFAPDSTARKIKLVTRFSPRTSIRKKPSLSVMSRSKRQIEKIIDNDKLKLPNRKRNVLEYPTPPRLVANKSAEASYYLINHNRGIKVLKREPGIRHIREYKKLQVLGRLGLGPKVYRVGWFTPPGKSKQHLGIEMQNLDGDIQDLIYHVIPSLSVLEQKSMASQLCSKLKVLLNKLWAAKIYHGDLHHGNIMYRLNNGKLKLFFIDVETVHTSKYTSSSKRMHDILNYNVKTLRNKKTWMQAPVTQWIEDVCTFDLSKFKKSKALRNVNPNRSPKSQVYDGLMSYLGFQTNPHSTRSLIY